MLKNAFRTKLIVIVGYLALICLAALGIILIYVELIKFSEISKPSTERKELVIISNTLATMYQAEGTASLLTIAATPELRHSYDSLTNSALGHVYQLKDISKEDDLDLHLDSVALLLTEKRKNTWKMVQLLDSIESKTIKNSTKTTVLSKKDVNDLNKLLIKKTQQMEDTTVVKTQKKKLAQRLRDVFNSNAQDSITQISKNLIDNFSTVVVPTLTDTVAEYINDIVSVTQKRNASVIQRLVSRQSQLYRTNENLTTQINQIMRDIEKREYSRALNLANTKAETIKRSSEIISTIGIVALALTIIFLSLALHSISTGIRLQKEVEKAKKYAENLLSSREQLLLTITHDIKAPISSIIGYIELLLKDKPIKKDAYYIENMLHSAEHILDLVRNLLDYHALDSRVQTINLMTFSPCVLASDIYQSFVPLATTKNLKFEFECKSDKNENYSSDPYRIRQITTNLLSNAIKFTPSEGTIVFSVTTVIENNQTMLNISVRDNGPGIKEEDKALLFEEFRRLNNTVEGSGLGLAITHRLAKLLKGSIQVESAPNKGSHFIVKIPLQPGTDNLDTAFSSKCDSPRIMMDVDLTKKILFIDDDIVQLNLLSKLLSQMGFSPAVFSNSTEALNTLQSTHFDIVFSDIQMPDMNGFELVERIRMGDFKNSSTIPVIALSASSNISEQKFKEAGFSDFLSKPFTTYQLIKTIEKFIGNNKCLSEFPAEKKCKGFESLMAFAADDNTASKAIIQSFIDENRKNMKVLKQAFLDEDWTTIENTSHKMLPLFRMISADEPVFLLNNYEKGCKKKENAPRLLSLIEEQIEKAEEFIKIRLSVD